MGSRDLYNHLLNQGLSIQGAAPREASESVLFLWDEGAWDEKAIGLNGTK